MMRMVRFVGGALFGAAVGAAVASVLAPQSGPRLQMQTRELMDEARRQGDLARADTAESLTREFRAKVNDPNAFTARESTV